MSDTTVDDRVVSLKFDNKQFEAEAKKTLSTLDKLDNKIKSQDAVKGLTELDKAMDKTIKPLNNIGSAVDGVKMKFSAMQIVALRTLERITDSAIDTGKKLISSLSIDQITTGWSKYEQKTANVQTLINSTGKSIEEINGYLAKLMWYSDETSFGFTDMTSALSTMVTTGGDMEKLIPMIEGIGNAVAYAGKGAAEFSRVIYNLNQSYSRGSLTTQDFRSVELAGASSKQLKEFLIQAAEEVGTIEKGAGALAKWDSYLSEHQITSEAMEIAFSRFSKYTEAVKEAVDRGTYANATEAMEHMSTDGFEKVAVSAFESAQNAKSFTEAIEATKDAVSSSWMDIFNSIFGNFAQARNLWTDLTERLYEAFAIPIQEKAATIRTVMGMSESWLELSNMVERTGMTMDYFKNAAVVTAKENGIAIETMISEYGTFEETLQEGWLNGEMLRKTFSKILENVRPLAKAALDLGISIDDLTEDQAKANGVTKEQIELLKTLQKEASMANTNVSSLLDRIASEQTGRQKLVNSFSNILDIIHSLRQAFKDAWSEIFPKKDVSFWFSVINKIQSFTERLKDTIERNIDKIKNVFKGLISIVDIIKTIGSAIFSFVKTVTSGFSGAEDGIFSFAEAISNTITRFASWLKESDIINNILQPIARVFKEIILYARKAISLIGDFMKKSGFIDGLKNTISEVGKFLSKFFSEFNKLPIVQDIFHGIQDAMSSFFTWVGPKMEKAAKSIHEFTESFSFESIGEKFKSVLKTIKEFFSNLRIPDGVKDVWSTFLNGIRETAQTGLGAINDLLDSGVIGKLVKGLIQIAAAVAGIRLIWKMGDVADSIGDVADSLAGLVSAFKAIPGMFASINFVITNYANSIKYDNILKIAKAIALISGSLIALSLVNTTDLWNAVGVLGVMTAAMAVLLALNTGMLAVGKNISDPAIGKIQLTIGNFIGIAVLMLTLSKVIRDFAEQDPYELVNGILEMGILLLEMTGIATLMSKSKVTIAEASKLVVKTGSLFTLALGLWTFAHVLEDLADIHYDKILEGIISIGLVVGAIWLIAKPMDRLSSFKFTSAIGILVFAYSLRALSDSLEYIANSGPTLEDVIYNMSQYATLIGLILALAVLSNASGGKIKNLGINVLAFAAGMVILADGVESIADIPLDDLLKASAVLTALGLVLALMVRISSVGDKKKSSFRGFVGSVVALGAVLLEMWAISSMDTDELLKGVLGISAVMIAYGVMMANVDRVKVTASSLIGTIVSLAAITVAILALGTLSWKKVLATCAGLSAMMMALTATFTLLTKAQYTRVDGKLTQLKTRIGKFTALTLALIPIGVAIGSLSKWMTTAGASEGTIIASVTALGLCIIATAEAFSILSKSTDSNYIEAGDIVKFALLTADLLLVGLAIGKLATWMTQGGVSSKTILASTIALSAGINAVAASMKILGLAMKDDKITVGKIGDFILATTSMLSVGIAIGGLSHWMTKYNVNESTMLTSVLALSAGISAAGAVFDVLALANTDKITGGTVLKFLSLTLALAPVGLAIGVLTNEMTKANVSESMILATTAALCLGIAGIAAAVDLITLSGLGSGFTIGAVLAFDAAVLLLGGLVALLGWFGSMGDANSHHIKDGVEMMIDIGKAIGGFFGGIVSGFVSVAVGHTIEEIGKSLSAFWENAKAFFEGMAGISDKLSSDDIYTLAWAMAVFGLDEVIAGFGYLLTHGIGLASLGKSLTNFWNNSKEFFDGVATLSESTIAATDTLSKVILKLTAAELISAISTFIGMGHVEKWTEFGTGLDQLGTGIKNLADNTAGITDASLDPALNAIAKLTDAKSHFDRIGGIVQDIIGVKENWAQFGEGLDSLGRILSTFGQIMLYGNDFPEILADAEGTGNRVVRDLSGLEAGIDAIVDLAEAQEDIQNIGGLISFFTGDKQRWDDFGQGLSDLGTQLVSFSEVFDGFNVDNYNTGLDALKALIEVDSILQSATKWTVQRGVEFYTDRAKIWSNFVEAVGSIGQDTIKSFFSSMSEIHNWVESEGIDAEKVSKEFGIFVGMLSDIADIFILTNIEYDKLLDTQTRVSADNNLSKTFSTKMEDMKNGVDFISSAIKTLYSTIYGKNITGVISNTGGIDLAKLTAAISIVKSIATVMSTFDSTIISSADVKAEELENASLHMRAAFANFQWEDSIDFDLIEKTLSDFTKGFEHLKSQDFWDESVEAVEAVGAKFVEYVGIGMKGAYSKYIVPAFQTIVNTATIAMGRDDTTQVAPANEYVKKFKIVGEHFAYGLRYGMDSKTGEIVKSVENMSETMVTALRDKLKIESPSKVTKEIGEYIGEGLVVGMDDSMSAVEDAADNISDAALNGIYHGLPYALDSATGELIELGSEAGDAVCTGYYESVGNSVKTYGSGFDDVWDSITDGAESAWKKIKGVKDKIVDSVSGGDLSAALKKLFNINTDDPFGMLDKLDAKQTELLSAEFWDQKGDVLSVYGDIVDETTSSIDEATKSMTKLGDESTKTSDKLQKAAKAAKQAADEWLKSFQNDVIQKNQLVEPSELDKTGETIEQLRQQEYKITARSRTTYVATIKSMTDGLTEVVQAGAKNLRDSIASDDGLMGAIDWVYDMVDKELSPENRHLKGIEAFVNTAESLYINSDAYQNVQKTITDKQAQIQENEAKITALYGQIAEGKEHIAEVTNKQTSAYDSEIASYEKSSKAIEKAAEKKIKTAEKERKKVAKEYGKEADAYKEWTDAITEAEKERDDAIADRNNRIAKQEQDRANDIKETEESIVRIEEEIQKLLEENLQLSEEINETSESMFDGAWDALVAYRSSFLKMAQDVTDIMSVAIGTGPDLFKEIAETTVDSVKLPEEMYDIMQNNLKAYEIFYEGLDKLRERGYNDAFIEDMKATGYENYAQIMLYADAADNVIEGVNSAYKSLNKLKFDEFTNNWKDAMNKVRRWGDDITAFMGKLKPEIIKAFKAAGMGSLDLMDMILGDTEHLDERIKEINDLFDEKLGLDSEFADKMTAWFSAFGIEVGKEFAEKLTDENGENEDDILASMILNQASQNQLATEWSNYGEIISNNFIESMKPLESYLDSLKVKMTSMQDEAYVIKGISSTPVASYTTPVTNSNGEVVSGVTYADQRYVYSTDKGGYFDPSVYSSKGTVNNNNTTNNYNVTNTITVEGADDPEATGHSIKEIIDREMSDGATREDRVWRDSYIPAGSTSYN